VDFPFDLVTGWSVLTELRFTNRIIKPWFSALIQYYQQFITLSTFSL
jgi:hypothetical protein